MRGESWQGEGHNDVYREKHRYSNDGVAAVPPKPLANVVIRLLFPYKHTVRSVTTDNWAEFCAHQLISKGADAKGREEP
ncbi:MAG: hypothetical protein K2J00_04365 [Bacteroidaceae bacterium]|nr:hypothetical protein [Bacteroidaceae bacterium]